MVTIKIASPFDIMTMCSPSPYVSVLFGSQKCQTSISKDVASQDGCAYVLSAEAPDFVVTGCRSADDVPVAVLIENANGEELVRLDDAGSFSYHDGPGAAAPGTGGAHEDITRGGGIKVPQSPEERESPPQLTVRTSATNSPIQPHHPLSADANTNTFGYPPSVNDAAAEAAAAQAQQQSNFAATAANFSQEANMLGTYRSPSFTDHYSRIGPPTLRASTSGWTAYSSLGHERYGSGRSPATLSHSHSSMTRPSLTPSLPAPHSATPQLIRTSTLQTGSPGSGGSYSAGTGGYTNPWALYSTKAVLSIAGNLDAMAQDWTQEEWHNKRRIVLFRKKQNGSHLEMSFRPVPVGERPTNSICISCIYWAEKGECFVTSVDTIHLLEQLVVAPARFSVEEKNRIRRNLEGFKPLTVSKAKAESEEFFKVIMGFGNPKPRNIEKDVKVFPWKVLGQALKKIISKYSASPSSTLPPATPTHLLTPVSLSGSYGGVPPPTPVSATTVTDHTTASGYVSLASHPPDSISSPRSLSGASSWAAYPPAPSRALSPSLKTHSPQPTSHHLRISTLPTTYDTRLSHPSTVSSPYGLPGLTSTTHHLSSAIPVTTSHSSHSTRWDSYDVGPTASAYTHPTHGQVYGGGYGDGAPRA